MSLSTVLLVPIALVADRLALAYAVTVALAALAVAAGRSSGPETPER